MNIIGQLLKSNNRWRRAVRIVTPLMRRRESFGKRLSPIIKYQHHILSAMDITTAIVRYYRDTYAEHPEDRKNIEYSVSRCLLSFSLLTLLA